VSPETGLLHQFGIAEGDAPACVVYFLFSAIALLLLRCRVVF
jgi:hypothetical protein